MTDKDRPSAGMWNTIFIEKLNTKESASRTSEITKEFLDEAIKEHGNDIEVTEVSVHKIANEVILRFRVGYGKLYQEHRKMWTEQELLSETEPVTVLMVNELALAVKGFRSGPLGRP